ncbi:hypothetical protein ACFWB2_14595 [Streptomyces virginiae]|uniref:hypothetical protein n=1 Tax=Streptomyces TaxID=1883 RepID=UPI00093A1465|nr:hypothetical protein [Streptomyces sp. MJM1172]OKI67554.1 hypothetical protein AMK15_06155 [Streptomyces sp. MJM1172]
MPLTAIADVLSERPEEPMTLAVLLGLAEGQPARIHQLFTTAPEIPEGATRGEYAALLRLTVLEVSL